MDASVLRLLLDGAAVVDDLRDIGVGGELGAAHGDGGGRVEVVLRQRLHLLRPRGAPHERLSVGTDLLDVESAAAAAAAESEVRDRLWPER